ncbi:acyl-CoA dehydrogenase [Streptomyces sp. WAC 06738]|uniref:acyl-CoA dehydrogenase family protein n=1 Tax=Streptomyces sp. WAC 06738 TaxID=2203210 RepID=UPI000F6E15A9|nr:acyl-CoA dehydrogenase [Streptomyces sp. WAC 06738]AZM50241.1 acyl-CoA dehydrogenase [Streptomyces sp. WAC 06738]
MTPPRAASAPAGSAPPGGAPARPARELPPPGGPYVPSPELRAVLARHPALADFAARVTDFLDRHLPEPVTEEAPRPPWLELRGHAARAGLTGFDVAARGGGGDAADGAGHAPGGGRGAAVPPGLERVAQGLAMYLAGRRDCDAREVFSSGHGAMALRYGPPAVAHAVRDRVVERGELAGVASSEPHSGSDLRGLRTVAVDHGDHLLVSGTKGLVSRVEEAVGFVVFCKVVAPEQAAALSAEGADAGDRAALREVPLSALWLPMDAPGVRTQTAAPLGLRGWSLGHLHFDGVRVGRDLLLGAPGDGRRIFDAHFAGWRLMMALVCLGAAGAAIDEAMARTRRHSVGRTSLASIPSVASRLGTAAAEVQAATAWCFSLLEGLDRDADGADVAACSAAKALATDASYRAVDLGLQLHGSDGYTCHTPMEKRLRDIRGLRIADGPNDVLYSVLAHALLEGPRAGVRVVRQRRI